MNSKVKRRERDAENAMVNEAVARTLAGKSGSLSEVTAGYGSPYNASSCPACGVPFADNVLMIYTHLSECCKDHMREEVS